MFKTALLLLLSLPLAAQIAEAGFTLGGGAFAAEGTGAPAYTVIGAELCAFPTKPAALFAEYNHWQRASTLRRESGISAVDLFATGLRLQGGREWRPFFDVGFAAARDQFDSRAHTNPGLALGAGVAKSIGPGWYFRPQVRLYVLRGIHAGFAASLALGYRF